MTDDEREEGGDPLGRDLVDREQRRAEIVTDHVFAAADVLARVDDKLGKSLRDLVRLKSASHYGFGLLSTAQRRTALRCAGALVAEARIRQP